MQTSSCLKRNFSERSQCPWKHRVVSNGHFSPQTLLMFLVQNVQAKSWSTEGGASRPGALPRLKLHVLSCFLQGYQAFSNRSPLLLSFIVQAQKPYIKQFLIILESLLNIFVSDLPFLWYTIFHSFSFWSLRNSWEDTFPSINYFWTITTATELLPCQSFCCQYVCACSFSLINER